MRLAKRLPWLSGSALTMKLTSPWRNSVTALERCRPRRESPCARKGMQLAHIGRGVFDEFEPVGAHRIVPDPQARRRKERQAQMRVIVASVPFALLRSRSPQQRAQIGAIDGSRELRRRTDGELPGAECLERQRLIDGAKKSPHGRNPALDRPRRKSPLFRDP
jgi:hypothetical protein